MSPLFEVAGEIRPSLSPLVGPSAYIGGGEGSLLVVVNTYQVWGGLTCVKALSEEGDSGLVQGIAHERGNTGAHCETSLSPSPPSLLSPQVDSPPPVVEHQAGSCEPGGSVEGGSEMGGGGGEG